MVRLSEVNKQTLFIFPYFHAKKLLSRPNQKNSVVPIDNDKIYVMHPSLFHSGSLASRDARRVHYYAGVTPRELGQIMTKSNGGSNQIYLPDDLSIFYNRGLDRSKQLAGARKKRKIEKHK